MGNSGYPQRIMIVAPTCFYYQVELFRTLAAHPDIDLTVYFCSKEALRAKEVQQMYNTNAEWGNESELLEGYSFKFLNNFSPFPSYLRSIIGLMNFGVWREIQKTKPDAVLLMSWMNPTWWVAALACTVFKVPLLYLTDANVQAERSKAKWKVWGKKLLLGKILFQQTAGALCAGTANKRLYSYYGIPEERLFPFAYSWGYEKLLQVSGDLMSRRRKFRDEMQIPQDQILFLFCGRLSVEKGLPDLLAAYSKVCSPKTTLLFVGDGYLRNQLETFVSDNQIYSVKFCGFQDRNDVLKYFAMSDLLVLPSLRETWGIVVNEALCFALPAIVSDEVGAGIDLVSHGYNGFRFPATDSDALANYLQQFVALSEEERRQMGSRSLNLIKDWTQRDLASQLMECLESIKSRGRSQKRPDPA